MALLLPLCQVAGVVLPARTFEGALDVHAALDDGAVANALQLVDWFAGYLADWLAPVEARGVISARSLVCAARSAPRSSQETAQDLAVRLKALDKTLFDAERGARGREARLTAGRRYLKIAVKRYPLARLEAYEGWVMDGDCHGHPAVVHGWVCAYLRVEARAAVHMYMSAVAQRSVQVAVERGVIGARETLSVLGPIAAQLESSSHGLLASSPAHDERLSAAAVLPVIG